MDTRKERLQHSIDTLIEVQKEIRTLYKDYSALSNNVQAKKAYTFKPAYTFYNNLFRLKRAMESLNTPIGCLVNIVKNDVSLKE